MSGHERKAKRNADGACNFRETRENLPTRDAKNILVAETIDGFVPPCPDTLMSKCSRGISRRAEDGARIRPRILSIPPATAFLDRTKAVEARQTARPQSLAPARFVERSRHEQLIETVRTRFCCFPAAWPVSAIVALIARETILMPAFPARRMAAVDKPRGMP